MAAHQAAFVTLLTIYPTYDYKHRLPLEEPARGGTRPSSHPVGACVWWAAVTLTAGGRKQQGEPSEAVQESNRGILRCPSLGSGR